MNTEDYGKTGKYRCSFHLIGPRGADDYKGFDELMMVV